ncbi:hypothetical protein V1508DRAFT_446953 [Lipomyces doorenjongii]|uniref:uncharacterized protein n=1 Tax=Lipomyces doorenjongii TaxID=383834 RepID=UPI0034D01F81
MPPALRALRARLAPMIDVARRHLTRQVYAAEQLAFYDEIKPTSNPHESLGSTKDRGSNRVIFGEAVNSILDGLTKEEAVRRVMVIDSDLEGSTGLKAIHAKHPEGFVPIVCHGTRKLFCCRRLWVRKQRGACISEITMARLNNYSVLSHFSHSGVNEMADNTCHFGLNLFFADNGLMDAETTALYFPADGEQMKAIGVQGRFC